MFINVKAQPWYIRVVDLMERHAKVPLFDCSMCGQCILRSTGLTCPMRCPKQMRNGPCGGSMNGKCEVFPERACMWHLIWDRSATLRWTGKLEGIQPALDWRLWGTPSWWNLVTRRIDMSGHAIPPPEERQSAAVGSVAKVS